MFSDWALQDLWWGMFDFSGGTKHWSRNWVYLLPDQRTSTSLHSIRSHFSRSAEPVYGSSAGLTGETRPTQLSGSSSQPSPLLCLGQCSGTLDPESKLLHHENFHTLPTFSELKSMLLLMELPPSDRQGYDARSRECDGFHVCSRFLPRCHELCVSAACSGSWADSIL